MRDCCYGLTQRAVSGDQAGTVRHTKLHPNSTLAGQVHTPEAETQMQKTRSKRTVEEIFLANVTKKFLNYFSKLALQSKRTKIMQEFKLKREGRKRLSLTLKIKAKS